MLNTKGIGPVIAVALLIVVTVSAVIGYQIWFNTYSSNLFTDIEKRINNDGMEIESLVGSTLYVRSESKNNLSIDKLSIGGIECSINKNLSNGMNTLNVSSCMKNLSDSISNIVLTTNSEILTKTVSINPDSTFSSNEDPNTTIVDGNFKLLPNGVVTCDSASVGDTGTLDGVTYRAVSNQNLSDKIESNDTNYYETACTSLVTDMNVNNNFDTGIFYNTNSNPDISHWDTSNVTDMNNMFRGASAFNQSLNNFNTSSVTNMWGMFLDASSFNQPLDSFDTNNVTDMSFMFDGASSFNQPLDNFNTSNVIDMSGMLSDVSSFNQPLNNFDTNEVEDMSYMFSGASSFNQPLDNFNTNNVTNMLSMFEDTNLFNQSLDSFNTSNVTDMSNMFQSAVAFNQPLDSFDTSNVISMRSMFESASSFNQSLNSFNTSNVTDMSSMFKDAVAFNQPLNSLNTGNVTDMNNMFRNAVDFNQDISDWNTSNVLDRQFFQNMDGMFYNATAFNQNISSWCVSNIDFKPDDFDTNAAFDGQTSLQPQWGSCP